jgi:hypothetical protein
MKDWLATYFGPIVAGLFAYWIVSLTDEGARVCLSCLMGWAFWMYVRHERLRFLHYVTDRQLVDTDARLVDAEAIIERLTHELDAKAEVKPPLSASEPVILRTRAQ